MKVLCRVIVLLVLVLGCQNVAMAEDPSLQNQPIVSFRFRATVDMVKGIPSFPVMVGDHLEGTFSYLESAAKSSNQKRFIQSAPAGVTFQLNSFTFNADVTSFPKYSIDISNDDASVNPVRDRFEWSAGDPSAAKLFNLDNLQAVFVLQDLTAKVFSDASLPQSLNAEDFGSRYMFINAYTSNNGKTQAGWHIRLHIDEITRL